MTKIFNFACNKVERIKNGVRLSGELSDFR